MTVTLTPAEVTTTQAFSGRLEFLQKRRSKGYISLDAVDTITAAVSRIGYYFLRRRPPATIVTGRLEADGGVLPFARSATLRWWSIRTRWSPVTPVAFRRAGATLKCESEGDVTRRDQYLADGLKILSDEARENRGGARFGLRIDPSAFQFSRLYQGR
jgi:hypothetical protein